MDLASIPGAWEVVDLATLLDATVKIKERAVSGSEHASWSGETWPLWRPNKQDVRAHVQVFWSGAVFLAEI